MMFTLSKVLLFLLFPITWVFLIFISAFIVTEPEYRNILLILGLVVFYAFSIPFLLDSWAKFWDYPPRRIDKDNTYSCAIVLGGFGSEKADGTGYFNNASDRFIQALELKETGKASHILITGQHTRTKPNKYTDGDWMKGQLKQFHLSDKCILIETRSKNTIENALYTRDMLVSKQLRPPYLLVTSGWHMRRSMLIFKKAGINVVPYPCNYIAGIRKLSYRSFLPCSNTFSTWEIYSKEMVGIIVAGMRKF